MIKPVAYMSRLAMRVVANGKILAFLQGGKQGGKP